ncbi:Fc.00g081790.m01.CDS01 [Cosmosporella sp. VM-42]
MDLTTKYSICLAGIFMVMLIAAHLLPPSIRLARYLRILALEKLCYYYVVKRHAVLGPWSAATVLLHILYVLINLGCVCYGPATTTEVASRAGTLSLINMAPIFVSAYLSFLADLFGVSLSTYRRIHRSCGITAANLLLVHGLLSLAENGSFSLEDWPNRYALIGISAVVLLELLSFRPLRRLSYELFLRLHQSLAGLFVFCAAKHLVSLQKTQAFWLPIYIFAGICGALTLLQIGLLIYRNKGWGRPCPRVMIKQAEETVEAVVNLSRPVRFHAGQYIVLWIPSLSIWSSHPFTVVSWSPEAQSTMRLLIEPRQGFTKKLLRRSKMEASQFICYRAFFSGPHGRRLCTEAYKTVIIFAEASGLTAVLPHIKELIHTYKKGRGLTRRIHLVWQVYDCGERPPSANPFGLSANVRPEQMLAKKPFIDEVLADDGLGNGYIFCGSIYDVSATVKQHFGRHRRLTVSPGRPDIGDIIRNEHAGGFILQWSDGAHDGVEQSVLGTPAVQDRDQEDAMQKVQRYKDADGDTLVLVSTRGEMKDAIRQVVRNYFREGFHLRDLDYQPS